jgi:ABC-type nitrate/sulfonate/bicarbonate transport system substrate-binding protein
MTYTTAKTTFLLNWYANPYHTPLFVAKEKGWLLEEGVDIAILETTNPSDVTEVVGSGAVDMGFKAMIHVLAAKDRGIDMKSFGTLLDEPPTGLIFKKSTKIESIQDLVGKKIGYIGHFGKIMVSKTTRPLYCTPTMQKKTNMIQFPCRLMIFADKPESPPPTTPWLESE